MYFSQKNLLGGSVETTELSYTTLERVGEDITSGGAVTSIGLTGLGLEAAKWYVVDAYLKNATASNGTIYLYLNNDTTASNYYNQYILGNNNSISGARAQSAKIGTLKASDDIYIRIWLSKVTGANPVAMITASNYTGSSLSLYYFLHCRQNTDDVTRIDLTSSVASSIDNDSRLSVYKPSG